MHLHASYAARWLLAAALWTGGVLCAAGAGAQFPQYVPPGSLAVPEVTTRERVEGGFEEARWDLGPLRLDPRIWIRDVGYHDNVFGAPDGEEQVSDVTATGGAGLVAYTHLGSDVVLSAYLLPEYTWWRDLELLREEQLNLGVGVFAYYNRLTLTADARRDERQRLLTSESPTPVDVRTDRAALQLEVDLRGPFELFGGIESSLVEHRGGGGALAAEALAALDRDETVGRLGAAYRFQSGLRLGVGVELSRADFEVDPAGRSNETFGPLFEVAYDQGELDAAVTLVLREIDFDAGVAAERSELTGAARLGWRAGNRLRLDVYGGRSLVYSAVAAERLFIEDRVGLAAGSPWGQRLEARVYAEAGTDDFDRLDGVAEPRRDRVTAFGGELDFALTDALGLALGVARTDYDSNLDSGDRAITVLRLGLRLGGDPRPW